MGATAFLKPIGWPTFAAWACVGLISLGVASAPEVDRFWAQVGGAGILALFAVWLLRFVIRSVLILIAKDPTLRVWRQGWRWAVPVAVLGMTIALNRSGVPLYLRFAASRPAMERLVQEVLTTPGPYPDRWVGLYSAREIERTEFGVRFVVQGERSTYTGRAGGFAYSTAPLPAERRERDLWQYRSLSGLWYGASALMLRPVNLQWLRELRELQERSASTGPSEH